MFLTQGSHFLGKSHHILLAISISQNILQSIFFVNEKVKAVVSPLQMVAIK